MNLTEKQNIIIRAVHTYVNDFNVNSDYLMQMPLIKFSNRMTSSGGSAGYKQGNTTLKFSNPIIDNDENDFEDYLRTTVPHEVAHLMDYAINGRFNGHSVIWKRVMIKHCGSNPADVTRTHSFKTVARKVKRQYVNCTCGTSMEVTMQKISKLRQGYRLRHNFCGSIVDASHIGEMVK